jgi:hypothetical protein
MTPRSQRARLPSKRRPGALALALLVTLGLVPCAAPTSAEQSTTLHAGTLSGTEVASASAPEAASRRRGWRPNGGRLTYALPSTLLTLLVMPVSFVLLRRLDLLLGRLGAWVMLAWIVLTTGTMTALIRGGVITSLTWQSIASAATPAACAGASLSRGRCCGCPR